VIDAVSVPSTIGERISVQSGSDDEAPVFCVCTEITPTATERPFTYCEVVVEQSDEETLARMWDSPEALPSLPEIDEPRLWLARTV